MATNAAHQTSSSPRAGAPRRRGGGLGRALGLLTRLALGGAGAALLIAPAALAAHLGPWATGPLTAGWTLAEALGAGLLGVAALWTLRALLRRPAWEAVPPGVEQTAPVRPASVQPASVPFRAEGVRDEAEPTAEAPAPPRVDDVDPAAVRSTWSASRSSEEHAPSTVPFPAAAIGPGNEEQAEEETAPAVAGHDWDEAWGEEGNEPSVIRFEDVPNSVEVNGKLVDLTEMDFEGSNEDRLKGLSKKERRTVRKALRDRERMLLRAA